MTRSLRKNLSIFHMQSSVEKLQYFDVAGRRIASVMHVAPSNRVVLLCHGYRGDRTGPNRFFVRLSRRLQQAGVGALRFDQYGSGDSAGEFLDSSFDDWVATTTVLAQRFLRDGYRVALLGQSMGGTTALVAAADLGDALSSVVAWAPDPSVDPPVSQGDYAEEGGQRVRWAYWREAHAADIARRFREIRVPTLVFLATNDEYVSPEDRQALLAGRQPHQHIEILEGHTHSSWTYDQAEQIIAQSEGFLTSHFG